MSAPTNIHACINDIVTHAKGKFPVCFPSMGQKGGAGCDVLSVDSLCGEIEISYKGRVFKINQSIYITFANRFNFLDSRALTLRDGRSEKYGVNRYQAPFWQNTPLGMHRNPLPATIFKGLGY